MGRSDAIRFKFDKPGKKHKKSQTVEDLKITKQVLSFQGDRRIELTFVGGTGNIVLLFFFWGIISCSATEDLYHRSKIKIWQKKNITKI